MNFLKAVAFFGFQIALLRSSYCYLQYDDTMTTDYSTPGIYQSDYTIDYTTPATIDDSETTTVEYNTGKCYFLFNLLKFMFNLCLYQKNKCEKLCYDYKWSCICCSPHQSIKQHCNEREN